ncbi:localization factor PodJL [Nitrobacteraceae bacterium AZCC 1564]
MAARVSLSVDGIEPSVLERAEASARRAGLSLGDWLNSTIGHPAHSREAQDVAEIHKRLDSIARQVEYISRAPTGTKSDPGVARQLNDAISRLDARLSHISGQSAQAPSYEPAPAFRPSPPTAPAMSPMDFSIAEIIARQGQLDGLTPSPAPQPTAAQMPAPSFAGPAVNPPPVYAAPPLQPQADFSGLERQLSEITSQIATLRRPDGIEQSIESFRNELAEIRRAITEALPRREIESLENEIRSLGRRIDETRQTGVDSSALAGIERALSEIYSALRTLTPAEQFAGFDEAIRSLGGKVDSIVRSSPDPSTIHQLEDAITALKSIASNVASNEALNELAGHLQALSAKVDQLTHAGGNSDILSALEQRIAVLTTALEQRDRPVASDTGYFDNAVRAISDRLDHLQVGSDSAASLNHVEQRVHHLLERLENAEGRGGNLSRVEEGLADILRHLEQQRASAAGAEQAVPSNASMDGIFVETIKRELSDIRFSQSETNRHTQDSLEAVHNTLGHVVDRLAQIESDLRAARSAPAPRETSREHPMPDARAYAPFAPGPRATTPQPRPELPNPAAAQAPIERAPVAPPMPPRVPAIADVAVSRPIEVEQPAPQATRPAPTPRSPIDPTLPPDHPLEPGTKPQQNRVGTPSERIAASEVVLNEISSASREPVSPTNFIQAARRAAQAAAAAPAATPGAKPNRVTALNDAARNAAKAATVGESKVSSRIRALLVGASVVVIVLGTVKMGLNLLSGRDHAQSPPAAASSSATPALPPVSNGEPRSENITPAIPSITSPTPIDRQSLNAPPPPPASPAAPDVTPAMPQASGAADVTGSVTTPAPAERVSVTIPPAAAKAKATWVPVNDKLPESIGSATLRAAANKGNPGAAFEIGVRYAEGRGVASDYAEAMKWYERASQGGIVPATFRLGALYEKGLGAKKDLETARRYYIQAAEKGSAKAMHNLAVLDADGGGAGPNYKGAAQWFRKAAERGVADSQFNLGILYARGIGVEQNLAESYKWFSLAAAQGDADSGRKRDDIAKRLDAQSLAAAKLAIQTFTPEAQPDDAVSVGAPPGGWDAAPPPRAATKSHKPAATKSAAR